ncbi:hypothetical protein PRZ48_012020 [Zasmidium cellare]|uniref:Uncharacterized protein n=1 Tax=Zasmidium cellare TaxID=395010 RepID=A0ABR0E815_ZASCE|nr:hypothetical protein PRZ48_012020 [Zasmidium cellare]
MSQDETYLKVAASSGDQHEKKYAARVLWLLNKGKHWVLVTLLLCNVITNETLPIVLHKSFGGGGLVAIVGSTVMIVELIEAAVIFGEIVPQAICVRYGLPIGAWTAPLVLCLMVVLSPVAWPAAKLLDKVLGEDTHGTMYKKSGLKTLIELHKTAKQLIDDEATIISSTLDLKDKPLTSIMTNIQHVFTMSTDTVVDDQVIAHILQQGYSRIPVHSADDPETFTGMLLVRRLIGYNPAEQKQVQEFDLVALPETSASTTCLDILNYFQEGKSHMVLISTSPGEVSGAIGIVTLEDVLEEIIGEEIIDESDAFDQTHRPLKRLIPALKRQKAHRVRTSDMADEAATDQQPLLTGGEEGPSISRSGSMTEKSIVVNGVEKVVLEMDAVSEIRTPSAQTGDGLPAPGN